MKTLNPDILTEIAKSELKPILLITFAWPNVNISYTNNGEDVTFPIPNGNLYLARKIDIKSISLDNQSTADNAIIVIDNIDFQIAGLHENYDFRKADVYITIVFGDIYDDSAKKIELFKAKVDSIKFDDKNAELEIVSGIDVTNDYLPKSVYQEKCIWEFGSLECGYTPSPGQICDKTETDALRPNSCRNLPNFLGFPSIPNVSK